MMTRNKITQACEMIAEQVVALNEEAKQCAYEAELFSGEACLRFARGKRRKWSSLVDPSVCTLLRNANRSPDYALAGAAFVLANFKSDYRTEYLVNCEWPELEVIPSGNRLLDLRRAAALIAIEMQEIIDGKREVRRDE